MPFDRNTAKVNIAPKNKNGKIKEIRHCVREQCSLYKAETAFILIEIIHLSSSFPLDSGSR